MDDVSLQHAWDLYQLDDRAALSRLFFGNFLAAGRQYENYGRDERQETLGDVRAAIAHGGFGVSVDVLNRVEHALSSGMDRLWYWLPRLVWGVPLGLDRQQFELFYKAEFLREMEVTRANVDEGNALVGWARRDEHGGFIIQNNDPFAAGTAVATTRRRREEVKRRSRSSVVIGEAIPHYQWHAAEANAIKWSEEQYEDASTAMDHSE